MGVQEAHSPTEGRTASDIQSVLFYPRFCRVVVAAPQEAKDVNQTGGLYQCDYSTSRCEPISLKGESLRLPPGSWWDGSTCEHTRFVSLPCILCIPGGAESTWLPSLSRL